MNRPIRPGIDRRIAPVSGVSRDGQPLSYNRAPSPDLAPWVARLYYTEVDAPGDHVLSCGLLNDTSFVRIQVRGHWTAETVTGRMELDRSALFFGPQSRRMSITVRGPFLSLGFALRPGAGPALKGPKAIEVMDRILPLADFGTNEEEVLHLAGLGLSPEETFQIMEGQLRKRVEETGRVEPEPISSRFEAAAHIDPTISIARFASDNGIEQRRLERIVRRDFGMPPKQVLRRARALDMASHLRGVIDPAEAEELALRYYDQSHLIREFAYYFGMSPRQFVETPQPLMTLALETRQARRLEMIERLAPGDVRPWE